ncbi:MAG: thioredoxin fold domain-containing protein [Deltaproteobacteria bacterium]|nr:thioredoxin fold domain-containing protein [Deltaproteobacteria bacterium]
MIRTCASCGTQTLIDGEHLAEIGMCGTCQGLLPPASEPIEVDTAMLTQVTRVTRVPILVVFEAPWCGQCRKMAPEVRKVAKSMAGKALVLRVDTEKNPELSARFHILGVPSLVILNQGKLVLKQGGAVDSPQMEAWLLSSAAK